MKLEHKLKTALDESRLLILGAQVLFGFQFQGVFQDGFAEVTPAGKAAQCAGLLLLLVAIGALIAASTQHQIVYEGESRRGALEAATFLCAASLLPLTFGLGASMFTAFDHGYSWTAGIVAGSVFTLVSLAFLYGLGIALRKPRGDHSMSGKERKTPLIDKIDQLLTEARVIIPGGQALLGFQFVATLTRTFSELPFWVKAVHAAGLCMVALAVVLLMTPAALHRVAYRGDEDEALFHIGSALVIAATGALAIGISSDVLVVFYVVIAQISVATVAALFSLFVLLALWFAYPLWQRYTCSRVRIASPGRQGSSSGTDQARPNLVSRVSEASWNERRD